MLKSHIRSLLNSLHQPHLSLGLEQLSEAEQRAFLQQLSHYASPLLTKQRQTLLHNSLPPTLEPLKKYHTSGQESDRLIGAQKKIGCLVLAGGQGSRLGSPLPKALTPVSLVKKKTLLQLLCEKAAAASKQRGYNIPLVFMTSPLNHEAVRSYLETHHFFGLNPTQVDLFPQEMLPFLDDQGNWRLQQPGIIACGPDGNGHALKHFVENGIWEKWKQHQIEFMTVVPIDNPLADPFDAELAGFHARQNAECTLKAIQRLDSHEKMGVICLKDGKIGVQEYSELPPETAEFKIANTSLFCLSLDFIKKVSDKVLPWHLARKMATVVVPNKNTLSPESIQIWKFETFLFDILEEANAVSVLVYPREQIYAPLKNSSGDNSLETLQAALLAKDKTIFSHLTGKAAPSKPFELAQEFHYPTPSFLKALRENPLPASEYLEI